MDTEGAFSNYVTVRANRKEKCHNIYIGEKGGEAILINRGTHVTQPRISSIYLQKKNSKETKLRSFTVTK